MAVQEGAMTVVGRAWRAFRTGLAFAVFGVGAVTLSLAVFPLLHLIPEQRQRQRFRAQYLVHLSFRCFEMLMKGLGLIRVTRVGLEQLRGREAQLVIRDWDRSAAERTGACRPLGLDRARDTKPRAPSRPGGEAVIAPSAFPPPPAPVTCARPRRFDVDPIPQSGHAGHSAAGRPMTTHRPRLDTLRRPCLEGSSARLLATPVDEGSRASSRAKRPGAMRPEPEGFPHLTVSVRRRRPPIALTPTLGSDRRSWSRRSPPLTQTSV